MPRPLKWILCWVLANMVFSALAHASQVILHSGETFKSHQVWEENDKIRFSLHGLTVSVKKEDVREIIHDRNDASAAELQTATPAPTPAADQVMAGINRPDAPASDRVGTASVKNPLPSAPQTKAIQGTGLPGLVWKASPASISGLVKIKTEPDYGGIDQYHRPNGTLQIWDILLDGMVYGFWRDQLCTVILWVEGRRPFQLLKQTILAHYGDGRPGASGVERYLWQDNDTDRMLEFDPLLNTGIFWMRSRSLDRQIKQLYPE